MTTHFAACELEFKVELDAKVSSQDLDSVN